MPAATEIPQIMKNPEISPELSSEFRAVRMVEISGPTSAGETIDIIQEQVVPLESKPFRVRRVNFQHSGLVAPKYRIRSGRPVQCAKGLGLLFLILHWMPEG